MLRLIRALWRVLRSTEAPPATLRGLQRRVESLEGDLEHLVKEHTKLRGRVTGGVRRPVEPVDAVATEVGLVARQRLRGDQSEAPTERNGGGRSLRSLRSF